MAGIFDIPREQDSNGKTSMELNPTIVFRSPNVVEIENRKKPSPAAGQVLIKTTRTLISIGTELALLADVYPKSSSGSSYGTLPFDPGYDNIGTVVKVGPGVAQDLIGKRVGTYGVHASYVLSDAQAVRPVPRDVSDDEATFFTIAEIVMNGVRRGKVTWGEAVVVYGLGLLGQLTVQFCKLAGARPIFAVDVAERRLACLPKNSAIVPVDAGTENVKSVVEKHTRGRLADVVFEVTGVSELIPKQFETLHKQGRFVILSSPRGPTTFNFRDLCNAPSYTIIGAHNMSHPPQATLDHPWTQHRHAELFFDLVADGTISVAPLITHREHYSKAPQLYEMLLADRSGAIGIILDWSSG